MKLWIAVTPGKEGKGVKNVVSIGVSFLKKKNQK